MGGLIFNFEIFVEKFSSNFFFKKFLKARLRGNSLALEAVDFTAEPILFVCEKLEFWPSNKSQNGLSLRQNSKEFLMEFVGGDCVDKWAMQVFI